MPDAGPHRVKSVEKAAGILNCFSPRTQVLSVRSLAGMTGIPRATVHVLCATLCDAGLLQMVPGRGYALGVTLVALGGQVLHRQNIIEAGHDLMPSLLWKDGTWVLVGQLVDGWIVYLARYTSAHHGRVNSRTGLRAAAHRTACGKAALSKLDDDEAVRRVTAACEREKEPLPDWGRLRADLARAREHGYVVSGDWRPGRRAIGAALIDQGGSVVGGISVGGPLQLMSPDVLTRLAALLVPTAARMSQRLPARGTALA